MNLEELGKAMNEAIILRGMIDSIDGEIEKRETQVKANEAEISRLNALVKNNEGAMKALDAIMTDRGKKQSELDKRLKILEAVGVKLPIAEKFGSAGRVAL